MNLSKLQQEQAVWSMANFGQHPSYQPLLGAQEELGELAHAHLKQEQGIRGTTEEHEANGKDAVADVIIYLADYCTCRGWDMAQIVEETWGQVKKRNWKENTHNGKP